MIGLGVLCTAAAFIVFFALIAEVGPARATVITYVNPAVAILLGALVLNEPLTIGMAIGFPLVIAGSFLGHHEEAKCPGAQSRARGQLTPFEIAATLTRFRATTSPGGRRP